MQTQLEQSSVDVQVQRYYKPPAHLGFDDCAQFVLSYSKANFNECLSIVLRDTCALLSDAHELIEAENGDPDVQGRPDAEKLRKAIQGEYGGIVKNGTYELVELP